MQAPEPRTALALIVLAAGALFSTYMLISLRGDDVQDKAPELSLAYYLDSAEVTGTAADGSVLYRVKAERAEQDTTDASIAMQEIEMLYGPADGLPWNVRADTGRIPAGSSLLELRGNVTAISGDRHPEQTEIRTPRLDIDHSSMEAWTNDRVTLVFSTQQLNATGLRANFKTNRLRLLANVNGKFTP